MASPCSFVNAMILLMICSEKKNDSKGKFNQCAERQDTKSVLAVTGTKYVWMLIIYAKMKGWRCIL